MLQVIPALDSFMASLGQWGKILDALATVVVVLGLLWLFFILAQRVRG